MTKEKPVAKRAPKRTAVTLVDVANVYGYTPTADDVAHIQPALRPLAVPVATLELDPDNAKTHPADQVTDLAAVMMRFGQDQPVVAQVTGKRRRIRKGGGRYSAAVDRNGWKWIAAVLVSEPDPDATARAISDNKLNERGEWDHDRLAQALRGLADQGDLLGVTGFPDFELDPLLKPAKESAKRSTKKKKRAVKTNITQVVITEDERTVIDRAVSRIRDRDNSPALTHGQAIMKICSEFLDRGK